MRALPLLLLLWPAAAGAETLADTHFARNFCWTAAFDREHLGLHPEQQVTAISLAREPLGWPTAPGVKAMEVEVRLRGETRERRAVAECYPRDDRLRCLLRSEGAGEFEIRSEGSELRLTVGERGMSFEGRDEEHRLRADEGEDREFLLRRCG